MKYLPFFLAISLPLTSAATFAAPTNSKTATRSWVSLAARTDKTRYAPGEIIVVHLSALNTSKRNAFLKFSSGQRFDFSVFKAGQGETAYTWSASRMFMQSLGSMSLKPGQTQKFDAQIGDEMGQLSPGKYRLVAHLTNFGNSIQSAPLEFEIAAPKLQISARTDKTSYKIGEPVRVDFTIKNSAKTPTRVTFGSGQTFDVFVFDAQNRQIWNYTANMRFLMVQTPITWQANETKKFGIEWNGLPLPDESGHSKLAAGKYFVKVQLSSQPNIDAAPLEIGFTQP